MDKSEILVHISAPSGVVDDARYRAQVEAILNFQTHSREIITHQADDTALQSHTSPESWNKKGSTPAGLNQQASQSAGAGNSFDSPVSVIPDSQPQHPLPEAEAEAVSVSVSKADADAEAEPASQISSSIPPPSKRPRIDPYPDPHPPTSNENIHNEKNSASLITKETLNLTLPLQITAPLPQISTTHFTTHITPTLEMLSHRLNSPRTYKPLDQTRELDKLERGHWYLRINLIETPPPPDPDPGADPASQAATWDVSFFAKFWAFLSDFVAKDGRAGWGVWCILEESSQEDMGCSSGGTYTHAHTCSQPVVLKVYTWGEIASHIYLLLFLASERRIRKMGAQWRDARDEVVIEMP